MTWPMHDAGSTTPEPGSADRAQGDRAQAELRQAELRQAELRQAELRQAELRQAELRQAELWPSETGPAEPGADEPGRADPPPAGRGRHAAAPDPLPPLDGPMPGGGPSPAETTLPLALEGPAPPRTPRVPPAAGPDGSVDAPPGWRRVPRSDGRPPEDLRPRYPQPPTRPNPAAPGARGAPGGPGGPRPPRPASPRATQRSSLIRSGVGMAIGTLASRGTGFLRTLVLTYAIGTAALGNAYNNPNTLPNTVYYLMLGGIFTSVVVPLLVRAARRDPDRGEAYT